MRVFVRMILFVGMLMIVLFGMIVRMLMTFMVMMPGIVRIGVTVLGVQAFCMFLALMRLGGL